MRSARIDLALDTGAFTLPDTGSLCILRPRAGDDLSPLPKDRVVVVTGFRPDYDHFAGKGYVVATSIPEGCTAAMLCLPRAKAEGRALLAAACAALPNGAPVLVDGQKTDGIDSFFKELRGKTEVTEAISKAHGKIFALPASGLFAEWATRETQAGAFVTMPGVFSADGPDRGSELLVAALPAKLPSRVVDMGAGWGYLSHHVLTRTGVKELHLVEAEKSALDCAKRNISDERAQFHWADATLWQVPHLAGAVVCNPPFHTGRDADPSLGIAFIQAAAKMLAPDGTLWLVANRHLPYDHTLRAAFREIEELSDDRAFRVIRASYPARRKD